MYSKIIGRAPSPSFETKEGLGGKRGLPVILVNTYQSYRVRDRDEEP